jgi:hypothetical protein
MLARERLSPAMAERQWHRGALLSRDGLPRRQWAVVGGLVAICAAVAVALVAAAFISDAGGAAAGWNTTVIYASAAGEAPPRPVSPGLPARRTQPRTVTLQLGDLASGARVGREGPASFSSRAQPPPSWDILMLPDPAQPADYEFVESLAVVYPSHQVAASAMSSLAAAERAGGANEVAAPTPVGDRQTVWVERTADRPGVAIVRVTWQSMNVVGEVSLLAPSGPAQVQRAVRLALVEQGRIGAPVAIEEQTWPN